MKFIRFCKECMMIALGLGISLLAAGQDLTALQGSSQLVSSSVGAAEAGLLYSANRLQTFEAIRQQQEEVIARLGEQRGAYGQGLDEAHSALGQLYFENEEYTKAAQAYKRAWHLSRVNSGLYSEQQLLHLANLIEALDQIKDWEQAQALHQLRFQIASRVYAPGELDYAKAAQSFTRWQWEAISERRSADSAAEVFDQAQQLSALYTEIIDKIEHANSGHQRELVDLVLGKLRTDLSISRALQNSRLTGSALGPGSFITETQCSGGVGVNAAGERHCRKVHYSSFNQESGYSMAVNFALGRYLKQVDDSIARLERICETDRGFSAAEINWLENLVQSLRAESDAVFKAVRRS